MTPHEIDLLMHYYARCDDHERAAHPGVRESLCDLARQELLCELDVPTVYGASWKLTEKGEVYCAALCEVPLPVKRWVMPNAGEQA